MQLTYSLPQSKQDITVKKYLEVSKLYKQAELNETTIDEDELLSVILEVPKKLLNKLPIDDYREALQCVAECLNANSVMHLTFELNGVKYGFIPNLEEITAGEYSAIDIFLRDTDANAYKLLNVLYRPIVKEKFYNSLFSKSKEGKYSIDPYNSDNDCSVFENAPYEIYESALVFFYNLGKDLANVTLKSMREMEQQTNEQQDLGRSGDGIKRMILMLKQSVLELTKFNTSLSIKYSND